MRYIVSLGAAALIASSVAATAQEHPKLKGSAVKMDTAAQKDAEQKMEAAKKGAESTMQQNNGQMKAMEKQQLKKAEQVQKEAGKGSEKGQAMRKEHSKKWWKFWGE